MQPTWTLLESLRRVDRRTESRRLWRLFLVVAAAHICAGLLYQHVVWTEDVLRTIFPSLTGGVRMEESLASMRTMSLLGYITLPFLLWLRVAAVALMLQFGFLLMWVEVPFLRLFRILTWASLTGAAMICVRTWLFAYAPPYEITASALVLPPFSLADIVGIDSYTAPARVVLENANLFEGAWLFVVWKGICKTERIGWSDVGIVVLVAWCVMLLAQVTIVWFFGGGYQ